MARKGIVGALQEYSIPLIAGVFVALWAANHDYEWYHHLIDEPLLPFDIFGHAASLHFLINDIFMVFFFGIAAKEITDAVLPGGSLNPPSKAINPLLGTLGGVLGPVGVFFALTWLFYDGADNYAAVANGWGVPTATDIALAWLVARLVFGAKHTAVGFLLLLAVADDAIGLGIIAVAYPDPDHPVQIQNLLFAGGGMLVALGLRMAAVQNWVPYIFIGGGLAWYGLLSAYLHPALALVFIVPFLPASKPTRGLISEEEDKAGGGLLSEDAEAAREEDPGWTAEIGPHHGDNSPLEAFEHFFKLPVDLGLFIFAFCNAGVPLAGIGDLTWVILGALVIGKTLGITAFSWVGAKLGFPLPEGMDLKCLVLAGLVAGLGLTVALFVAGEAYPEAGLQGEAKMGALFSGLVFVLAIVMGRVLGIKRVNE